MIVDFDAAAVVDIDMTWFQLMVPVPNHDVTKNLSHRMHLEGPQIHQMSRQSLTVRLIAFRICVTCYRQKFTVLPGKSILCKITPKNQPFW